MMLEVGSVFGKINKSIRKGCNCVRPLFIYALMARRTFG